MIPDANGLYTARSPQEMQELLQMALNGNTPYQTQGTILPASRSALTAAASPINLNGYNFAAPSRPAIAANSGNYRANPKGNFVGDAMLTGAEVYGDLHNQMTTGLDPYIKNAQRGVNRGITRVGGTGARRMAGRAGAYLGGLPGMGTLGTATKILGPAVAAGGAVLGVGDIVFSDNSGANKAMDTAAMTVGGILGSAGGPLGTAAGAGIGKMVSDGTQWLFGDKKTPEQRKMELALAQLQGGGMI